MKTLSVVAFGLLLANAGRLDAQAVDPVPAADDPFSREEPASRPVDDLSKKPKRQIASQPDDLFPPVLSGSAVSAAHRRIERALNHETTFDYLDQPLRDVIEDISYTHNIPIVIDVRALDDHGIDTGIPITKSLKGVTLRSALRLAFRELELTYVIRDEVLQITTSQVAAVTLSTRFYHVTDLLPPDGDGNVLVELIRTSVLPDTWGGIGAITYVAHLESLVISHHDEAFREIEQLLATAKKLAEMRPPGRSIPYGIGSVLLE